MKLLLGIDHFFLFFFVSWTVYNTFILLSLIIPTYGNIFLENYIWFYFNMYMLGILDPHELFFELAQFLSGFQNIDNLRDFYPLFAYSLFVNSLAVYIWCAKQTPLSACFLAIVPCIAGPYLGLLFVDYRLLFYGIIGTFIFYALLYAANSYRKKRLHLLMLPGWAEWRKPGLVPPLKWKEYKIEAKAKTRS